MLSLSISSQITINDLPKEVFEVIFLHLNFKDTLACSLVCRQWLELVNASQHIGTTTQLTLDDTNFDAFNDSPLLRRFRCVSITDIDFSSVSQNMAVILELADEVKFVDSYFASFRVFRNILRACCDLKYLEIESPQVQNRDERWLAQYEPASQDDYQYIIEELFLNLEADQEGHTWELLKIFRILPIKVQAIQVSLDAVLHYEPVRDMFHYIYQNYETALRGIRINDRNDEEGPSVAYKMMVRFIRMEALQLSHFCTVNALKDETFFIFLGKQQHLVELELGQFTEEQLECVLRCLPELEIIKLTVHKGVNPTYLSENLHRLQRLRRVTLALEHQDIYDFDVSFIGRLAELESFRCASDDENRPKLRMSRFKEPMLSLREFCVSEMVVKYSTLQKIFRFLPNLEGLLLFFSFWVKPGGLLGCKSSKDLSIGSLKHLKSLALDVTAVNDQVLTTMKFSELQYLEFVGYDKKFKVTDTGLRSLGMNCPKLMQIKFDERQLERDKETQSFRKWIQMDASDVFGAHSPNDSDSDD